MSVVSIVVPVFHNEASLEPLMEAFRQLASRHASDRFEFIFVDDGSKDRSWAVLESLASRDSRVMTVKLSRNFGSNAAILAGLACARGDVVGAIAADLQDPPELFDEMLALWREGRKVVLAARRDRRDHPITIAFADAFYRLFRRFALAAMPPRGFDVFLIDRSVVDIINGIQENNAYLMGLIIWIGFDPAVIEYDRRERPARFGRSMWTFRRKIKHFIDAFVAFSHFPIRAASLLGIVLSFVGAAYAVAIVVLRFAYRIPVQGWTSLMVVLLVVSGAQLLMLGILGEYVWRTLDETRHRPRFIVEKAPDVKPEDADAK